MSESETFELDQRLQDDSVWLGDMPLCRVLMSRDGNYPWLILVPRREGVREVFELSEYEQGQLTRESSSVAQLLRSFCQADKINVAALGNMVPQLHLHHVARFHCDPAWPKPIWGAVEAKELDPGQLQQRAREFVQALARLQGFQPAPGF